MIIDQLRTVANSGHADTDTTTAASQPTATASPETSNVHFWKVDEEKMLVQSRFEAEKEFNGKKCHDKLWDNIATTLKSHNILVTGKQCKDKFKNMKKKYMEYIDNQGKTGAERLPLPPNYSTFDDLYGNRATAKPKATIDSMAGQGRAGKHSLQTNKVSFLKLPLFCKKRG